jgi:hypothetical protein
MRAPAHALPIGLELGEGRPRHAQHRHVAMVQVDELVKLTVVQDNFEPGSAVAEMVSAGWPMVLSSVKTLLETDDAQPVVA